MRTDLMAAVEAEASTNGKLDLLRAACAHPPTFRMLQLALDPYTTFGITVDKARVMAGLVDDTDEEAALFGTGGAGRSGRAAAGDAKVWWSRFCETVLLPLSERKLTGAEAKSAVYLWLSRAPTAADADWATRVLNKDLACGVGATSLNKVVPKAVRTFKVALAYPLFKKDGELAIVPEEDMRGDGFIEPKIDGERCIVLEAGGLSRYGREILGEGIGPVVQELHELVGRLPRPFRNLRRYVFDGELIGEGTFEQTIGQIRTVGKLTYHVFDVMTVDEWHAKHTRPFAQRRADLQRILGTTGQTGLVRLVQSFAVTDVTLSQLTKWRDQFIRLGYEGAMWKRASARYPFKRSDDTVKVKPWETYDFRVVDWYPGEGNCEGLLGGIRLDIDGVLTDCGSGFSEDQRERWKLGPDFEWAEVKYQNKTAKGSLRHPVFIRPRYDKRDDER